MNSEMTPEYAEDGSCRGPEDVEVADGHGGEPVELGEHLHVLLADQFLQGVGRQRARRHVLALGQCRGVAIGRRTAGVDDALHAGVARRDEQTERGVDVGAVGGDRVLDRARHRRDRRLMQDVLDALDGASGHRLVGEIALDELDLVDVREIASMAGDQAVDDANAIAPLAQGLDHVRPDEAGPTGDQIERHVVPNLLTRPRACWRRLKCGSRPVSRILSARAPLREYERAIIPLGPALLTASSNLPGGFGRAVLERLPIWSCSVRGFACHDRHRPRGALLPHLFTLTHLRSRPCGLELRRAVYFLCHFPSGCPARALPGALPCGVRTFLQQADLHPPASDRLDDCRASIIHRVRPGITSRPRAVADDGFVPRPGLRGNRRRRR